MNTDDPTNVNWYPCPGCKMPKNEWVGDGYSHVGQIYCCQGCAEGTGCFCKYAESREEVLAMEQPREGEQLSGAEAPQGELSGERDAYGTEEPIDRTG
jgi:hypothetical protein